MVQRVTFYEMAKILETKDIARIYYTFGHIDIITDDDAEYIFRFKAWSTFRRVFKLLFRCSIIIDMHKVLTYHLGGITYQWHDVAPALLKSPSWLDFLVNLNPNKYIRYETQDI